MNDPLSTLRALGRQVAGETSTPRVDAQLELDGPSTARLMLFITSAAHQAMADGPEVGTLTDHRGGRGGCG